MCIRDRFVDVVDTGSTLKANGLVPLEHVSDITSRLIVNRASMKIRHERISQLIERITAASAAESDLTT